MAHPARARAGAALVCALTSLLLGWSIGFRDLAAYVVFWALGASVGVSAMRIVRRLFPWRGLVDASVRGASIAFALVVGAGCLRALAARVGHRPCCLLIAAALYALARGLGAPPPPAAYVPACALLSRPIVEQAVGADVDLVCWSMLLTALYLGFVAIESNDAAEWALGGVVVGLYAGTKYVSLVYAPVLVAQAAIGMRWKGGRATRSRAMLRALPGLLAFGAPWYLRNWIVAGSPIYPSSLTVAGVTLAPGAYTHAAMNHSLFHTTDPRLLPVMLAHAFGTPLILFWLPVAAIGGWAMASARPRREAWLLLAAPLVMIPLYWFAIPDYVDSRFMRPIALLALLPLAFVFRASRGWTLALPPT